MLQIIDLKNRSPRPGIEPRTSGLPDQRANHYTTEVTQLFEPIRVHIHIAAQSEPVEVDNSHLIILFF